MSLFAPSQLNMTKKQLIEYIESLPDGALITASPLSLNIPDFDVTPHCNGVGRSNIMTEKATLVFEVQMSLESSYQSMRGVVGGGVPDDSLTGWSSI